MVQKNAIWDEVKICGRVIWCHFVHTNYFLEIFLALADVVQANHADVGLVTIFSEFVGLQNYDLISQISRNYTLKDFAWGIGFIINHSRLYPLRN